MIAKPVIDTDSVLEFFQDPELPSKLKRNFNQSMLESLAEIAWKQPQPDASIDAYRYCMLFWNNYRFLLLVVLHSVDNANAWHEEYYSRYRESMGESNEPQIYIQLANSLLALYHGSVI